MEALFNQEQIAEMVKLFKGDPENNVQPFSVNGIAKRFNCEWNTARKYISIGLGEPVRLPKPYAKRVKSIEQPQPKLKTETNNVNHDQIKLDNHVSYAFGRIEGWIESYAASVGVSPRILANRVSELLRHA